MTSVAGVTAVIVAGRGGDRLARSLASVTWAEDRLVLDPAGRLEGALLPAGTRRAECVDLGRVVETPWVVLLQEDETAPIELAAALRDLTHAGSACVAYRLPVELHVFGLRLCPRRAPVRVARCAGANVWIRFHAGLELETPERRPGRLETPVAMRGASSLTEGVDDLEADGSVAAALLAAGGARARVGRATLAALVAGTRILVAHGMPAKPGSVRSGFLARWSAAVFAGYRTLLAYAMLWEQARREVDSPA